MTRAEELEFLKENYLDYPSRELGKKIGRSKSYVLKMLRDNNLNVSKEVSNKFRSRAQQRKTTITPSQEKYILEHYKSIPVKRIAKNIGRSQTIVRTRLRQLGLKLSPELMRKNKLKGQFKSGHEPFNKGQKMVDILSPESMERVKKTWFKKGHIPGNAFESDGAITTRSHKGRKYKYIRISLNNWRALHVHNWEKENGPVPDGMIIVFKNGDTMNCSVENLEMISMEENMKRNSIMRYPEDLRVSMRLIGKLNRKISQNEQE